MTDWHLHPQLADDTHPLGIDSLCEWRLMDDANYPWLILVPRVAGATELIDLNDAQQQRLMHETAAASRVLRQVFSPDKLNMAALGNLVPQLHVHVIARFRNDPAWPAPVWGRVAARSYAPEDLVQRIRQLLAANESPFPRP